MRTPEQLLQVEKTVVARGLKLERRDFNQAASGSITLQGMFPDMTDVQGLLSSPLTTAVYDSPSFRVYSATYEDNVFYGQRLDDLLDIARPRNRIRKHNDRLGKYGALGDWAHISPSRIAFHQAALDPYWSEYMEQHNELFVNAMRASTIEEIQGDLNFRMKGIIRRDVALKRFDEIVHRALKTEEEKSYKPMRHTFRYLHSQELLQPFADQAKLNLTDFDLITNAGTDQLTALVASLPAEIKEKLIDRGFLNGQYTVVNMEANPDEEPKYGQFTYDNYWGRQYLGDNKYRIFFYDSWVELQLNPDGSIEETERFVNPHEAEKGLIPHFLWVQVKNTGQRLYLSSKVPEWFSEGLDPRANTYLGLTVAKKLSGVIFPYREKLSNRSAHQPQKEAQTVLQNSWRRNQIINDTDFFSDFEGFIEAELQHS